MRSVCNSRGGWERFVPQDLKDGNTQVKTSQSSKRVSEELDFVSSTTQTATKNTDPHKEFLLCIKHYLYFSEQHSSK